eukprot:Ihof_evm6s395 gene=Ihof_evmTU6s395
MDASICENISINKDNIRLEEEEEAIRKHLSPYEFLALPNNTHHGVHFVGQQFYSLTRVCTICLEYLKDDAPVWACGTRQRVYCCSCIVDWLIFSVRQDRTHSPITCPDKCLFHISVTDVLAIWIHQSEHTDEDAEMVKQYLEEIVIRCPECLTPRIENGRICQKCWYNFVTGLSHKMDMKELNNMGKERRIDR